MGALLPAEKQGEVLQQLQELHEIYLADTHRERLKLERSNDGEMQMRRARAGGEARR
jgi:hypothetical protein